METKRIILGIHNEDAREMFKELYRTHGCFVDEANSLREMITRIEKRAYHAYLMDANFGSYANPEPEAARIIYPIVREQVESNNARFLAISGNHETIEKAASEGIPAQTKPLPIPTLLGLIGIS